MENKYSRTYTFNESYLSCYYCDLNYRADISGPGFCQEYSVDLDILTDENLRSKAVGCPNFVPRASRVENGGIRTMISKYGDGHVRWYEKEQPQ
jgi:hypothetical protein